MRHPVNIRAESAGDTTTVPATAQFVYQVHELDKPEYGVLVQSWVRTSAGRLRAAGAIQLSARTCATRRGSPSISRPRRSMAI
jgi:hypothetical protein